MSASRRSWRTVARVSAAGVLLSALGAGLFAAGRLERAAAAPPRGPGTGSASPRRSGPTRTPWNSPLDYDNYAYSDRFTFARIRFEPPALPPGAVLLGTRPQVEPRLPVGRGEFHPHPGGVHLAHPQRGAAATSTRSTRRPSSSVPLPTCAKSGTGTRAIRKPRTCAPGSSRAASWSWTTSCWVTSTTSSSRWSAFSPATPRWNSTCRTLGLRFLLPHRDARLRARRASGSRARVLRVLREQRPEPAFDGDRQLQPRYRRLLGVVSATPTGRWTSPTRRSSSA